MQPKLGPFTVGRPHPQYLLLPGQRDPQCQIVEVGGRRLPDAPLTGPGVQFSRTGLFKLSSLSHSPSGGPSGKTYLPMGLRHGQDVCQVTCCLTYLLLCTDVVLAWKSGRDAGFWVLCRHATNQ